MQADELDECQSELFGLSWDTVREKTAAANILSLDVFDTILARRCVRPIDVFSYLEEKFGVRGFRAARVSAEAEARRRFRGLGEGETSIEEIYSVLEETLPSSPIRPLDEFEAEKFFLYSNPDIQILIAEARRLGKRIIAISDIYYSSQQIGELLNRVGVTVDKVYSSSDFRELGLGKFNGKIFAYVAQAEGVTPSRILHVGDNFQSDFVNALEAGFVALHVAQLSDVAAGANEHVAKFLAYSNSLSASVAIGAMVKRRARARGKRSSLAEQFGYDFGGPLLAGFVKFIIESALRDGVKNLVLLARDGVIVGRALDVLRPKGLRWRIVPSSRRMAIFPLFAEHGWEAIQPLMEGHGEVISESKLLKLLKLEECISSVSPDNDITQPVEACIASLASVLKRQAAAEKASLLSLLAPELEARNAGEGFAWVDVGWALSSITALNRLVETPAPGYFIGSHKKADPFDGLKGFLFERGEPEEVNNAVMSAPEVIELIFSDTSESVAFLSQEGGGLKEHSIPKSASEATRDAFVRDVRRGALAFLEDIADLFPFLNVDHLQSYNQAVFQELCSRPPSALYAFLCRIPHDRASGDGAWHTIGDFWNPDQRGSTDGFSDSDCPQVREELALARRQPGVVWLDLLNYRLLQCLLHFRPLLKDRTVARLMRSAAKRNPNRSIASMGINDA
ncbi:HAD family hydrolase [Agrobacterium salinitolerans]|uniref:HAD family hydrolase n=1 Tax=Agrobacterium salinitolerans TaxID=1183413 RepID=UPI0022B83B73|nr:HAD family hydrolase [Agrobacterium salinitolerans]MCZ7887195.1 hypothetical protein [Agrobacterium salinitolerans]